MVGGPDGNLWYTNGGANTIGKMTLTVTPSKPVPALGLSGILGLAACLAAIGAYRMRRAQPAG